MQGDLSDPFLASGFLGMSKLAADARFDCIGDAKALVPALPFSHLGWARAPTWEPAPRASTMAIFTLAFS